MKERAATIHSNSVRAILDKLHLLSLFLIDFAKTLQNLYNKEKICSR